MTMVPAPASTVVLMRPRAAVSGPASLEVFLLRRTSRAVFLPDVCVFPGGRVDDEADNDVACALADRLAPIEQAAPAPTPPSLYARHLVAALRELFEEAGVLLATTADGQPVVFSDRAHDVRSWREAVACGHTRLDAVATRLDATLCPDALVPQSRWITPPGEPRRFDTWVLLAEAPPGQDASADGEETLDGMWLTPDEALTRADAGLITFAPPTSRTLEDLRPFTTPREALEAFRQMAPPTFAPQPVNCDGCELFVLPGDPLHPGPEPGVPINGPVPGPTRFTMEDGRWRRADAEPSLATNN